MKGIEGHDDVIRMFRQAIDRGRLGHAYLLIGRSGIGKRRFATALAQTLLCENRASDQFEPCGTCPACHQVAASTHPDLIQLGRQADQHELPIDSIRQLIHDLGFKPDRGRYKIAIVNDADDLSPESANCFLKCLEEPPPRSLIMLIGTSADMQLATIRSRCQVIRFQPLPAEVVGRLLLRSGVVSDEGEAGRLARMSGGSMEIACGLADPELAQFRSELARSLAAGRIDPVQLAESVNALVESAGKESAEKRARARLLFGVAADLLHCSLQHAMHAATAHADEAVGPYVEQIAKTRSPESLVCRIEHCLEAEHRLDRMGNIPLVIESWCDAIA